MDESVIRGLVMGGMLAAVGFAATLVWKLVRSPSEAARRGRLVLMGTLAVGFVAVAAAEPARDRPVYIIIGLAIIAGIWVFKGRN